MSETEVVEAVPPASPEAGITPPAQVDPFALDEAAFASLSPEQRASIDPILDKWKGIARSEIEKSTKSIEERYKPVNEKAQALDQLVQQPAFVSWWQAQQQAMAQGQSAQTQAAVQQSKPQDFASPEEWSQAVLEASNGLPQKLQGIQARMFATMATPVVQQLQERQKAVETREEMRVLMEDHPDYKDLDRIGLDAKGEGTSLLEHCLDWAEKNGKPLDQGYQLARRWADAMGAQKKAEAMGIVQGKKDAITAGPSTASSSGSVVYVDNQDELIKKSMEAAMDGRKDVRFEIRPKTK